VPQILKRRNVLPLKTPGIHVVNGQKWGKLTFTRRGGGLKLELGFWLPEEPYRGGALGVIQVSVPVLQTRERCEALPSQIKNTGLVAALGRCQ